MKRISVSIRQSGFYVDSEHNKETLENPSSIKKNHEYTMDAYFCSLEDDRCGDIFSIDDHIHGCDFVHFPYDHDMRMDSWKILGDPIYDSSNKESENFEGLGIPIS